MKARDFLRKGELAIIIFTDGSHFHKDINGDGSTGYWVLNPKREYDKVIIYHRRDKQVNDIYIATPTGLKGSNRAGKYVIELKGISCVGTTDANWYEFAELSMGAQSPIHYLEN